MESISYRTGRYGQKLSYRQVNRYRNTHDSYRLKYRSLPDYTGRIAEYWTSRPKNGYRAVLKTWRKWKKLAAESSWCRLHWLFSHVVGHSPSLRPSILSSCFSFFFFLFSFDRDCSSCAFCFSCVWLSFFFFYLRINVWLLFNCFVWVLVVCVWLLFCVSFDTHMNSNEFKFQIYFIFRLVATHIW